MAALVEHACVGPFAAVMAARGECPTAVAGHVERNRHDLRAFVAAAGEPLRPSRDTGVEVVAADVAADQVARPQSAGREAPLGAGEDSRVAPWKEM